MTANGRDRERTPCTARPGEAVQVFRNDDGSFAIGVGRVTIAPADVGFVAEVVENLGRLVYTAAAAEVLQRGDAISCPVRIVKPEPPNAWRGPHGAGTTRSPSS